MMLVTSDFKYSKSLVCGTLTLLYNQLLSARQLTRGETLEGACMASMWGPSQGRSLQREAVLRVPYLVTTPLCRRRVRTHLKHSSI